MAPLLELTNVTKNFGGLRAVSEVSMSIKPGEFVSIIGPNGAGKTTLFNLISGVSTPSSGRVAIKGREIRRFRPDLIHAMGLARTFQVVRAIGSLSIRENIMLGAAGPRLRGTFSPFRSRCADADLKARVGNLIELTELGDVVDQPAIEASPGHLRRMEIARALAAQPDMILMDEPAAGIGITGIAPLKKLIGAIHARGIAVLLVEHHIGFALSLCDRAVVLESGAVLAEGVPSDIREDPRVIEAYLGPSRGGPASVKRQGS